MGNETLKSYNKRMLCGDFKNHLIGHGIDIGCGNDLLQVPQGHVDPWDQDSGDAQFLNKIPNNFYDFVYSSHCLEHLSDISVALEHWIRVLKPGGSLYITVPDYTLYEKLQYPSRFNPQHLHTFSLSIFRQQTLRINHWHITSDVVPLLDSLGISIDTTRLEDHGFNYNLGPEVDQTSNSRALAQICIIGKKSLKYPLQMQSHITQPTSPYHNCIGLLIENGIGDVLTSFCTLPWLRKAYPQEQFHVLISTPDPNRRAGMRNIAESHPDITAVHDVTTSNAAHEYSGLHIINISPWHFLNPYSREFFSKLSYFIDPHDHQVATKHLQYCGRPLIVIQPFSSNPLVNWSAERWQQLVWLLSTSFSVVLVGGSKEAIIDGVNTDVRGQLTVRETIAVALQATAVVTARSFLSIATMDASIPTLVMTPPSRLHELEYAYPPSYFSTGSARLVDTESSAQQVRDLLQHCISKSSQSHQPLPVPGGNE